MYLFRGEAPVTEMAEMFPGVLKTGIKLFGGKFFKEYPFEEAYFLPYARQFRAALSMPLVLLGGINRLDTVTSALDDGFAFVQIGRALCANPSSSSRCSKDPTREGAVHPLQQVHADDLHRHALRPRRLT